ncbi:MAG: outer membrane beta-barrel protein [Ekhidna sp.]|nr:outer membrane beta-barrel protein [Ekhidna sp.]
MKTNVKLIIKNVKLTIKTVLIAVITCVFQGITFAQEEKELSTLLEISGSVDVYYRSNLNASNNAGQGAPAPTSSFANLPGFSLGMANLIVSKSGEKAGFAADIVLGPRGNDAVFGSTEGSSPIVNQLYAYWDVSRSTTLTMGNFNTFLGYEVISPTGNYHYSTSYMFSYGPFSHTGVKADFTFRDFSLMTAIMNTTDATEFSPDGRYLGGIQLGYKEAFLNFLFDDNFFQADLTAGKDLSDKFYLGVNATTASGNFHGGALYLQNSFSDDFSLGLRGEYFSDEGAAALGFDTTGDGDANAFAKNVIDLTLSANYSVGDLTFIPELRVDMYNEDVVMSATRESLQSSISSFVLAAVYSF